MKVYDWIAHHAHSTPDHLAQIDLFSGRHFTYLEMHQRVAALTGYLRHQLDVNPGDRVAVLAFNSSDQFEINFACARLGAVFVPLNIRLAEPELAYMLNDIEAQVLFCDLEFATLGESLAESCRLPQLISFSGTGQACDYETGLASAKAVDDMVDLKHEDLWVILYTSGTTGRPKGAMLTHGMAHANAVNQLGPARLQCDSVNLTVLPQFHTSGLNVYAIPTFLLGGTVATMRSFDASELLRTLGDRDLGISHFIGVPSMFKFMAEVPAFGATQFGHIVSATIGGTSVPRSLLATWEKAGLALQQGYGMTETGPGVTVLNARDTKRKEGSCGKPVLALDIKLVTREGATPATGQIGEIWVKGPAITPGYWRRPDANESDFVDGWLKTGDAAYCDEEGFYYIADRWKDMYISGGENVYPAEVEGVIGQLDEVLEVAVIGVADEQWGEVGHAFISLKKGKELAAKDVQSHCLKQLAKYKNPRTITFMNELPHNATGKLLKRELKPALIAEKTQS